ncbi:MAG: hypothetical protein ACXVGQ_10765 [Mycobacteriaceae bacterium]
MRHKSHDEWVARLTAAARSGEVLDLTAGIADPALLDPAQADSWPQERRIPASAIRATLRQPHLNPHGLRIRGAYIAGGLDLEHITAPCPLHLTYSRLDKDANLTCAHFIELNLTNTYTPGVALDGAHITGDAVLRELTATGEVRALDAQIGGELNLTNATLTNNDGDDSITLDQDSYQRVLAAQRDHARGDS